MIYEKLGEEDWRVGSRKFFKLEGGKVATNPDHEMLTDNGYTIKDAPPISEPIPYVEPDESKWRTYMNSISWNKTLTWGKS